MRPHLFHWQLFLPRGAEQMQCPALRCRRLPARGRLFAGVVDGWRDIYALRVPLLTRLPARRPSLLRDTSIRAVCIVCVVTRLNVYLPDDLAAEAKKAGLNLSAVTQDAVRRSLAARSTDAWLAALEPAASHRVTHDHVLDALDAARDEPPTRHG